MSINQSESQDVFEQSVGMPLHQTSLTAASILVTDLRTGLHLETSENRFRALIEHSNDVILLSDREGNYSYASPSIEQVLGYTPEEFVQLNGFTIIHPDDIPSIAQAFQTLLAIPGYSETRQFRGLHKNGSWRWVEATATNLLHEPGVQAIVTNFHDFTERKHAEEAQRLLAAIVASSDDAIVSKTLDGVITSWNDTAVRLFGYSAEEAIGRHISLIIPPELQTEEVEIIAKLRKGMRIDHFETVRVTKDGRTIDVSLSISPVKDGQGTIIGAAKIARDITERKRAEERKHLLQTVSDLLASSLDHHVTLREIAGLIVPSLADYCRIAIVDEQQQITEIAINHIDAKQLVLVRALYEQYKDRANITHGVQKILKTGESDLVSTISGSFLERVQNNPELLRIIQALGLQSYMGTPLIARNKIIGAITYSSIQPHRHYTPDDLAFAEELAGRIALSLDNARLYREVQTELAERKRAEAKFRQLFDSNLIGVFVSDFAGSFLDANDAFLDLLGYTREEMLAGKLHRDTLTPPEFHSLSQHAVKALQEIGASNTYEKEYLHKSGRRIPVLIAVKRIEQTDTCIGFVLDISERKELDKRKDEFISMASHELKTPVTSLKGFTHVLQRRLARQGDDQSLAYLAKIERQVDRLTGLISELLDLSKIQIGKLDYREETFDLFPLVQEIVENVQGATPTHRLLLQGHTHAQVLGDKDRIGQVLINLLTNAIKYSPQADKVIVDVSTDEEHAIVSVQDFGIGIAKEHQQRIYDRFYQVTDHTGQTYPGLGIGLYLSYEIIERHQGTLWVESTKGKGATFSFSLPLAVQEV